MMLYLWNFFVYVCINKFCLIVVVVCFFLIVIGLLGYFSVEKFVVTVLDVINIILCLFFFN